MVGLAGEGQNFDGNGQYVRFQPGGGDQTSRSARRLEPAARCSATRSPSRSAPARASRASARRTSRTALLHAEPIPTSTARPTGPSTRTVRRRRRQARDPQAHRGLRAIVGLVVIALLVGGYILSHQRFYAPALGAADRQRLRHLQGGALDRAGRSPRARARRCRSRASTIGEIGNVDARRTAARRDDEDPQEVHADLQRRDRAAAAEDRPQRHDRRSSTPGDEDAGRGCPRATRSRSARRCRTSTSTSSSPSLDADTRDYLQLLVGGAARGPRRQRPRSSSRTLKRFEPTARDARPDQRRARPRARRTSARSIHNFRLLARGARRQGRRSSRSSSTPPTGLPGVRRAGRGLRETLRLLPGTLDATRQRARRRPTGSRGARPDARRCGPPPRALGPRCARCGRSSRDTTPVIQNQLRPFVARRRCRRSRPAPGGRRPRGRSRRPDDVARGRQPAVNELAYNPPGEEEGFLFWAAWANHDGAIDVRARRTRTARSAAASLVTSAARRSPLLAEHRPGEPGARHAVDLLNPPAPSAVCPQVVAAPSATPSATTRASAPPEGGRLMQKQAPSSAASSPWSCSRCRASACCSSCGSPSAARSRSSRRATASTSTSRRPASSRRRPTCGSPACTVGKVKTIEPDPQTGRSDVDDRDRRASTRRSRATRKAILRQKTLLGETYVELTPGDSDGAEAPGGRHAAGGPGRADGRARRDLPRVRRRRRRDAFQLWMQQLAVARSTAAARTSTTRSASSRRSPRTRRRCCGSSTRSSSTVAAPRRATPATCSTRSASATASCAASSRTRTACSRRPRRATGQLAGDVHRAADVRARVDADGQPARRRSPTRRTRS